MSKLFADDPVQGYREFSFLDGHCVVLTSTVLVYIVPAALLLFGADSAWCIALSIASIALGLHLGKEKWRRVIAVAALACLFLDNLKFVAWFIAYFLTSAIDGWRVNKRREQLLEE